MHDLKFIRENPVAFDAALARRSLAPLSSSLLEQDSRRRSLQTAMQEAQARRNEVSQQIGVAKKQGQDATALMNEVAALKEKLTALEAEEQAVGTALEGALAAIPNMPAADVPDGKDEHDNVELRRVGTPKTLENVKDHVDVGGDLGLMDFETAAKMSGARFTILKGQLARLQRAIGDFMLDSHTQNFGYTEIAPPLLVKSETMFGTAQLPKFAEDQFQTTHGLWLIPTAEVSLTNMVADSILDADELPLRVTAHTACFRAEAGAAGRDTRGMIRQHQFQKVELVSITTPDQSEAEHERMTEAAESILKKLELPFRTIVLCTGDMGFASRKTYDIEVWLPAQNTYREISSCSNCGDFQARRMKARFKAKGDKSTQFVHTLNGSGLAVGRCLVAILENYQQPDGSVIIPDVLRPYMGGLDRITRG